MNLQDFPTTILIEIFYKSTICDLKSLFRTSKVFNKLGNIEDLWRKKYQSENTVIWKTLYQKSVLRKRMYIMEVETVDDIDTIYWIFNVNNKKDIWKEMERMCGDNNIQNQITKLIKTGLRTYHSLLLSASNIKKMFKKEDSYEDGILEYKIYLGTVY